MQKKRILVTGFGPFPGMPDNPSATLAGRLAAGPLREKFNLSARVLPTAFGTAGAALRSALDEVQPDIVICFGVAANRDRIYWERAAWNVVDPAKKDAMGHKHKGAVIAPGGAPGYAATLPLPEIAAALAKAHIPAAASSDAGDYLCNYIFYQLMRDCAQSGTARKAGFVHIPMPKQSGPLTMDGITRAAEVIIQACADDGNKAMPPRVLRAHNKI